MEQKMQEIAAKYLSEKEIDRINHLLKSTELEIKRITNGQWNPKASNDLYWTFILDEIGRKILKEHLEIKQYYAKIAATDLQTFGDHMGWYCAISTLSDEHLKSLCENLSIDTMKNLDFMNVSRDVNLRLFTAYYLTIHKEELRCKDLYIKNVDNIKGKDDDWCVAVNDVGLYPFFNIYNNVTQELDNIISKIK